MDKFQKLIKPNVLSMEPYSSARDEYLGTDGIFLDANENPFDLPYNRYPDPYQRTLKAKIGEWRGINTEKIFLGNGSDEVIDLLIRATCITQADRILSLDPSYGMYKVSAAVNDIEVDLVAMDKNLNVDEESLFGTLTDQHKLIFICSPNNPNGALVDVRLIERLLRRVSGLVVVDEAYIDYSDSDSWIGRMNEFDNLIILQTFSKSLGAAGIRLGIGYMHPFLVQILNKIKPPYNISVPNQEMAIQRLDKIGEVNELVKRVKREKIRLESELRNFAIVECLFPSQANFLLVKFYKHDEVYTSLINNNIVVRDRSSNTHCDRCLRITIGTEEENQQLIQILKSIK